MKLIGSLLLALLCLNVCAQHQLTGKIYGAGNAAVASAVVTINEIKVLADSTGFFVVDKLATGKYSIEITHLQYNAYHTELNVTHDTSIHVQLLLSDKILQEVVVTGNTASLQKSDGKLTYNLANSVMASGSTLYEAVTQVPGIRVDNNTIVMAGRSAVKVMINRRIVYLTGEDLVRYLRSIPANDVSKIELISNPSAAYDVEGNSGIINIITKKNRNAGSSGNLQLSAQRTAPSRSNIYGIKNFGEVGVSGSYFFNSDRWSTNITVHGAKGHLLEGFETDVFYPTQQWLQTDTGIYKYPVLNASAGVEFRLNKNVVLGASYNVNRTVYKGSDHVNNPILNAQGAIDSTLKTYAVYYPIAWNNSYNVFSEIKLDTSGTLLTLNADYLNYYRTDHSDFESNGYNGQGALKPGSRALYTYDNKQNISVYTFRGDVDFATPFAKFSTGSKISFIDNYSNAFYYNRSASGALTYDTSLSNEFNYQENTQALYGSMTKEQEKWKVNIGARAELTQTKGYSYTLKVTTPKNYFKLFPSALISYQADTNNSFSVSYGKRVNRPTFWSLNPFKSLYTAYSYGMGNPYLQPEYTTNIEVSHNYKRKLTSTLFATITSNGFTDITFVSADTNLVYRAPLNFISLQKFGLSENLSLKISSWWESNQLAMVYHTDARFSIPELVDISGFGGYFSSNNTFTINKTFTAAANFWYQFPEINTIGRSDRYYKLDVGVKATAMKSKMDVAFNLFDAFRTSAPSITAIVNGIPQRFTRFQVNRFYQLAVTYRFGSKTTRENHRTPGNEEEKERI